MQISPHKQSFPIKPTPIIPSKLLPQYNFHLRANQVSSVSVVSKTENQNLSLQRREKVQAFRDYQFLFTSQRIETSEPIKLNISHGTLPRDFPSGTYYLTGPGIFTDDHGSTVHPLDGHGYLRAFEIDGSDGHVTYVAKYVRTEAYENEFDPADGSWKFSYRGPFSVLRHGRMIGNVKVMKNVANTTVLSWGGRLFCLWEGGEPYEVQPQSLDTLGRFETIARDDSDSLPPRDNACLNAWDFAGRLLKPILHGIFKMPSKRILSHYKVDVQRNRLIFVSCEAQDMLLPRSHFTFYEFDPNFNLLQKHRFEISDHLMVHDWAITESYYILFANRIKLDIAGSARALCGLSPMISILSMNPSKSTTPIYLLPRFPNSSDHNNSHHDWRRPIEAPPQFWLVHVANAYEVKNKDGILDIHIHASVCSYHWFNFQKMFGYDHKNDKLDPSMMNGKKGEEEMLPHLVQVTIKLDGNGNCQRCCVRPLNKWKRSSDFPVINPKYYGIRHKYVYAVTSSGRCRSLPHFPYDSVVKLDVEGHTTQVWSSMNNRFIGEPVFAPKGHGGDGYLILVEYAATLRMCYLVILDADRIGEADVVVARFEIPKRFTFPLGFHGTWAPKS